MEISQHFVKIANVHPISILFPLM